MTGFKLTKKFEMNGKVYLTDNETLKLLREQVNEKRIECITAIMTLGLMGGRIKEVA